MNCGSETTSRPIRRIFDQTFGLNLRAMLFAAQGSIAGAFVCQDMKIEGVSQSRLAGDICASRRMVSISRAITLTPTSGVPAAR